MAIEQKLVSNSQSLCNIQWILCHTDVEDNGDNQERFTGCDVHVACNCSIAMTIPQ